ncbi:MAG: TonB-dependent receptor [Sphingorhabdus sp.]
MRHSIRATLALGTMLASGLTAPTFAQTTAPEASEETNTGGIQDIIVIARKMSESIQTVPVAVSAFSSEDLEKQQITSITQLQTTTPNLNFSSAVAQPGSATVFIRGQGSSDGLIAIDQAVGTYINGVYNARSTGGAFDMVDVQRVEVLRGPQGTLFGRNTTGGAINIIPNEPTGELEGSLRADYGNYNAFLTRLVLNVPMGDEFGVRVAYQHRQHDGYGRNVSLNRDLGDAKSDYVRATFKIEPTDSGFKALLSADYTNFRNHGELVGLKSVTAGTAFSPQQLLIGACNGTAPIPALNGLQVFCPAVARGPLSNYIYGQNGNTNIYNVYNNTPAFGKSKSHGASGIFEYTFSDAAVVKSTTAWRGVTLSALSDNDGTPYVFSGGLGTGPANMIEQDQFSQELQLSGTIDRLQYILGGFYFVENGTDRSRSASLFPLSFAIGKVDGTVRNKSTAGFGQLIYEIVDGVRLTGGLRYTEDKRRLEARNRDQNFLTGVETSSIPTLLDGNPDDPFLATFNRSFNYWSYLASADWQATQDLFFYAKTSRSQRSGGFNTRAVEGGTPPISFRPEEVTDYEVGAKISLLDRRVRLNLAAFNSDVKDVQRNLIGVAGTRLVSGVDNAASARIRGVEAELTFIPVTGLTLGANFGLTDASYKNFINSIDGSDWTNAEFPYTPKYTIGIKGDYEYSFDGTGTLKLHGDYGWRSKQYAAPIQLSAAGRAGLTAAQIAAGNAALQDTARIPGYALLNARIAFQLEEPDLEFALFATNITKEKYFTRLLPLENTPFGLTSYYPGDPRTYGISATFKFGN